MITRIISLSMFILTAFSFMSQAAYGVSTRDLEYNVFLDGDRIGSHKVRITPMDTGTIVEIEASFTIKFLIFEAYRYIHYAREEWNSGCLNKIQASTNDNGNKLFVNGRLNDNTFTIKSRDKKKVINGCVRSFAYWDPNLIQASYLLNSQNGQYTSVDVVSYGYEKISLGQQRVNAMRYRINGDEIKIDLWYSPEQEWLALSAVTESGARLRYERVKKSQ